MTRSYILIFALVLFRTINDYIPSESWWEINGIDISNATIWAVWVLPPINYEI